MARRTFSFTDETDSRILTLSDESPHVTASAWLTQVIDELWQERERKQGRI